MTTQRPYDQHATTGTQQKGTLGHMFCAGWHHSMEAGKKFVFYAPKNTVNGGNE